MVKITPLDNRSPISALLASRDLSRLGVEEVPKGWSLSSVGDACEIRNDLRHPISVEDRATMQGKFPYYGPTGVLDYLNEYRAEGEFVLIGEDGDHFLDPLNKQQTVRISGRFNVNNHAHLVSGTDQCDVDWFAYFFLHRDIFHSLTRQGANRFKLTKAALSKLPILLPSLPEQRRIAQILRTWDEAIEKLEALQSATKVRKSSIFRELFEQEFENPGGLVRAKFLFEPVSERGRTDLPLLAVMQEEGIVRRDQLQRRVTMPDGDISNYKVVRPGDFVISLRSFEGGLEYSEVTGLVSPAYSVLRPVTEINGEYYRQFFKSRSFIGRLDNLIFGIRDGKQIAFRDFGDMRLPNPELDKQADYAAVMKTLNDEVSLYSKRIDALQRQKRGLMQKLLTGEWRVNAGEDNNEISEKEIAHG